MINKKHLVILLIGLTLFQQSSYAAFWNKDNSNLGNEIKKEEFPDSKDVEPKRDSSADTLVIKGGIEAAKVHKFLVSTLFRNGSVLNNEDIIRVLDG